jgi:hypothetical protein
MFMILALTVSRPECLNATDMIAQFKYFCDSHTSLRRSLLKLS